ncbi:MAG: YbaB/EbfC family nucleoid-associated protein [Anaerolineae bacterium]
MAKGKGRGGRGFKPGGDIASQVQKLQEEMLRAQEALGEETVEVSVGGGAVVVVIDGHQRVRSVKIDPEAVDPEDIDMLQDLILAAVNEAIEKSQNLAAERLGALTGGLGLPGLF